MQSETKKILGVVIAILALIFCYFGGSSMFEKIEANEIAVIQSPIKGEITIHTTAGTVWQGWGKVTKYPRSSEFVFIDKAPAGVTANTSSIKVRFNDGGHAMIGGGLRWEAPLDETHIRDMHILYGSHEAVENQLILKVLQKALGMTGPIMSSFESSSARRPELQGFVEDQFLRGTYKMTSKDERKVDATTGLVTNVRVVEILKDPKTNVPLREETSPIETLGIKAFNLTLSSIEYDPVTEAQLVKQQQSSMEVQLAIAEAKKAEQETATEQAKGAAAAAKAEWAQKALAATAVTEAQMKKDVALLDASTKLEAAQLETQAAEQKKLAEILMGEGEAMRRQLVMAADSALDAKLSAWVAVNTAYATSIGNYTGNWVPSVVFGKDSDTATANSGGASQLLDLLTAKTAKDLSIDMTIPTKAGVLPPIKRPDMSDYKYKVPTFSPQQNQPSPPPAAPPGPAPTAKS